MSECGTTETFESLLRDLIMLDTQIYESYLNILEGSGQISSTSRP